jgi:hypothetical protein
MGRNPQVAAGWIVMGLGVLGLFLIQSGTGIVIDNRGLLGPFDPPECRGPRPRTAFGSDWRSSGSARQSRWSCGQDPCARRTS